MNLTPPYQHPMIVNGQLTQPWRVFFENMSKTVQKLNEANTP